MRRKIFFGITVLVSVIVFSMASCGGNNPKALAKQTYDLGLEVMSSLLNPSKTAELDKKAANIEAKVSKLSASDKAVYDQELARLSGQALGGLLNLGGDLLNTSEGLLNVSQQAMDALNNQNLQDSLNTAQQALDTAKQAADLLNNQDLDSVKNALNSLGSLGF